MPKKTPPPFKLIKAPKGHVVTHLLITVDLEGHTDIDDLNDYDKKHLDSTVDRLRKEADDPNAEIYYVPVVLAIPKKPRPVKKAKAKAKKVSKPKQVDTQQQAPTAEKKRRTKKGSTAAPAPAVGDPVESDEDEADY